MSFYQGDQYSFILKMEVGGNPIDIEGIELIEFTIGSLSKNWPLQVTYDKDKKLFYFPVTQEETFKFDQYEHIKQESNISMEMFTALLLIKST